MFEEEVLGKQHEIKKALDAFIHFAKTSNVNYRQIALHVAATCYLDHLNGFDNHLVKVSMFIHIHFFVIGFFKHLFPTLFNFKIIQAREHANLSLHFLETQAAEIDRIGKNLKKSDDEELDDSKRRKAGIYLVLANICIAENKLNEAEEYINKALKYEKLVILYGVLLYFMFFSIEKDPKFHYIVLFNRRKFANRNQRLEISLKLLDLAGKDDRKIMESCSLLAEDYLANKKRWKAEEFFWKLYKNSKGRSEDKKSAQEALLTRKV